MLYFPPAESTTLVDLTPLGQPRRAGRPRKEERQDGARVIKKEKVSQLDDSDLSIGGLGATFELHPTCLDSHFHGTVSAVLARPTNHTESFIARMARWTIDWLREDAQDSGP